MQAMEEELEMLRSGVAVLLHRTTPVPRRQRTAATLLR